MGEVTVFHEPRYYETDQQGLVFNMWYLAYFEEARNAWLAAHGYGLHDLIADGLDIHVVHTEIDWHAGVSWPERVALVASVSHLGRTSVTFDFEVRRGDAVTTGGRTVYVIVDATGAAHRVPDRLRAAVGEPAPLPSLARSPSDGRTTSTKEPHDGKQ